MLFVSVIYLDMTDAQSRVEDYLDDQIQTAADLDGIDALLARVDEQQSILQNQVGVLQQCLPVPILMSL